jgi:hypothetical protein
MNEAVTQLYSCFGLFVLLLFWQFGWKRYAVDLLRQSLFPVRNKLFMVAAKRENGLEFTSPAYVALRDSLNARIRFAHRISFSHLWLSMIVSKLLGIKLESIKSKVDIEIEAISDSNLKTKLREIERERDFLFFRHLLLISPIFLLMVWCTVLYFLVVITIRAAAKISLQSAIKAAFANASAREMPISNRAVALQADKENDCLYDGTLAAA